MVIFTDITQVILNFQICRGFTKPLWLIVFSHVIAFLFAKCGVFVYCFVFILCINLVKKWYLYVWILQIMVVSIVLVTVMVFVFILCCEQIVSQPILNLGLLQMKLLTHNFLSSRFLKNVNNGYPLILRANQKANKEVEFNEKFVLNMMPKVSLFTFALIVVVAPPMCTLLILELHCQKCACRLTTLPYTMLHCQ